MSGKCSAAFLEKVVEGCLKQLGPCVGNRAEYGTRLGSMVTKQLRSEGVGIEGLRRLHVGRSFKTLLDFPATFVDETIESFVHRDFRYYDEELRSLFWRTPKKGKPYRRKLGRLIPDLVVELPDGSIIIWDLTSKTEAEHLAKSLLYARIASASSGGRLVHIGEFYWAGAF